MIEILNMRSIDQISMPCQDTTSSVNEELHKHFVKLLENVKNRGPWINKKLKRQLMMPEKFAPKYNLVWMTETLARFSSYAVQ